MEDRIAGHSPAETITGAAGPPVAWRDLRDWIALVEANGLLKRIATPVDADEEIAAITLLATRREDAPALLFEQLAGDRTGSRILSNMLGASKERYALAVGLDPGLSTAEMIAATRDVMNRRITPVRIAKDKAPVNEVVLTGDEIDLTAFPVPKFWPGDGGRYIGTGDITLTASPDTGRINVGCYRQMLHGPRRVGLYCSPGKHGLLDREAWWARGEAVRGGRGLRHRSRCCSCWRAQVFGAEESELDVAGGIMGRAGRTDRGRIRQPADPGACRIRDRGPAASGRRGAGRPARRVHRLLRPRALAAAGDRGEGGASPQLADLHPGADGANIRPARSAPITRSCARRAFSTISSASACPGVVGAYAHPAAASGWGMVVVSLQQQYAGHAAQVLALAAQCPAAAYYTKWVIAVDEDVDPTDFNEVLWALSTRCHPADDHRHPAQHLVDRARSRASFRRRRGPTARRC